MEAKTKDTKHTPGPAIVRFFGGNDGNDDGQSMFFVECRNNNVDSTHGIEIMMEDYGDHNGYPREQRLADANLIADAINISTKTGMSPSSLSERVRELTEENERMRDILAEVNTLGNATKQGVKLNVFYARQFQLIESVLSKARKQETK